jgi:hypothetical protein
MVVPTSFVAVPAQCDGGGSDGEFSQDPKEKRLFLPCRRGERIYGIPWISHFKLSFSFSFLFKTFPEITGVCGLVGDKVAYVNLAKARTWLPRQFSADDTRQPDTVSPRVVIGRDRKRLEKS